MFYSFHRRLKVQVNEQVSEMTRYVTQAQPLSKQDNKDSHKFPNRLVKLVFLTQVLAAGSDRLFTEKILNTVLAIEMLEANIFLT